MNALRPQDLSREDDQLVRLDQTAFLPLPPPYDQLVSEPALKSIRPDLMEKYVCSLDGVSAVMIPKPQSEDEERILIEKFLSGLKKLFNKEDNWTFIQPLMLTMEYCANCQTCADACPIYQESGEVDIYRPTFRSETLRELYNKYVKTGGAILAKLSGKDITVTWEMIARLAELAYRCTICRRCAQACPIGIDNGLVTREIRKLFSQELGISINQIHTQGTVQQLQKGSSTGMTPVAFKDTVEFLEDEVRERTNMDFKWPIDKPNADILLLHNAGEFLSWPENPEAFAIILEAAGISYTLSSDLLGYDGVNYGVWYDDVQFARIALKHAAIAKKLGVKKIVLGECGHAHKGLTVIADRIFPQELNVPRESAMTLLHDIVMNGRLKLDPTRNDFYVTLHDPCNLVRLMGIVKPQREILRKIVPEGRFREMTPHGVENYCCGGGSGFAIVDNTNFSDWRNLVSGRKKFRQILDVFADVIGPENRKYVCAPCSNCKGQIRETFTTYGAFEKCNLKYGGLVELIVNAMTDIQKPFIEWDPQS